MTDNHIYIISDTHFGDSAIIKYENRPFLGKEDMDDTLITNWNRVVKSNDIVYHLGDFCFNADETADYLSKLNGIKYLIKGNHDLLTNAEYRKLGFSEVYDKPIIVDDFWILSHEPLYVNENMPYANIFGHVHSNPAIKTISNKHCCVSVERINYSPIKLKWVKDTIMDPDLNKLNTI